MIPPEDQESGKLMMANKTPGEKVQLVCHWPSIRFSSSRSERSLASPPVTVLVLVLVLVLAGPGLAGEAAALKLSHAERK